MLWLEIKKLHCSIYGEYDTEENVNVSIQRENNNLMGDNIAHIVYAADNKFAEILGVSLVSLFDSSKDMVEIIVYILDSGISKDNKEKIVSVCDSYNRHEPIFIEAKNINKELSMEVNVDRGSLSQYARLFVSSDLPSHLERVIYLDCDIIINQSISHLWKLDLHGKIIAALMDAFSKYYRKNIDLEPNDIMFNSGVMVIDLNLWKMLQVEKRLMKFIARKNGKIQQGDQGALNAVLSHDVYCFDPRFNSVTIFYDFTYKEMLTYRKPPEFYSEDVVRKAIEDPIMIHFTTSVFSKRPWFENCQHKYLNKWMYYKEMSPWKDVPLWDDNKPGWKKKGFKVLCGLPRGITIWIACLLQVYVRPFTINLINRKQ